MMTVGEKIKQTRLSMGLSQRQLCGDHVTRNMLSQIENGSARPSMTTLAYFAARLDKPISYFLDESATVSPNQRIMEDARTAYAGQEYETALTLLADYQQPDPICDTERGLLKNLCLLALAAQASNRGQLPYAEKLLDRVDTENLYFDRHLQRQFLLLSEILPEGDDRELLLRAQKALENGDADRALSYLRAAEDQNAIPWHFLCGKAYFAQKDYRNAISCYEKAEKTDPKICLSALEACYRELGDFENAYLCACKLREL